MGADYKVQIVIGMFALMTAFVAWLFKYRIAELSRKKGKEPQEVLFAGYETLLKKYQDAVDERDKRYGQLEATINTMQSKITNLQRDLDAALQLATQAREASASKDETIRHLEAQLSEMKKHLVISNTPLPPVVNKT